MSGAPRLSREAFLRSSGVSLGTILVAGAGGLSYRAYDQGVLEPGRGPAYAPWSHWQEHRGLLPLVAAATLAPSPHNAQAWLFRLAPYRVDLIADTSRGTGAIDPFQRELYVGLGAALENLVLAADAHGLVTTVALMPEGPQSAHAARIELRSTPARESELYRQIPRRHTDRYPYARGKELPPAALRAMQSLTTSETPDARLFCYASRAQRTRLGELIVAATEAIVADPDQARSDYNWFRQSWDEIQRRRDGITVDAAGLAPSSQPRSRSCCPPSP
ncbi:MAG TPA: hypothetical protein VK915_10485 [Gaiellaceae bacterium]|nr:hypothetical protein [Gaiellaceae bacterium]